jgi:FkbM family methyltransferase
MKTPDIRDTIAQVTKLGSQEDEQGYIWNLVGNKAGTYVDVGASHAWECSNTSHLYQRGWRGLLIEPNPYCWYGLLRDRPGDMLCPYAVSSTEGMAALRLSHSVSSIEETWPISETGRLMVEAKPLSKILEPYQDIRDRCLVCSIDVEGHEEHVLRGIDWETFSPDVFVIEYRLYNADEFGPDISENWSFILQDNGYMLWHKTNLNHIWKKR